MKLLQRLVGSMCGLAVILTTAPALAQTTGTDRVFVDMNISVQEGNPRLAVATPLPAFGREGTLTVDDEVPGGGLFDVSAAVKVRGSFALGAGYSFTDSGGSPPFVAVVPSPIGTNLPLTTTGVTQELRHAEQVLYLKASWMRAATDRFVYAVSAGPAVFRVEQDIPFTSGVMNNGIVTVLAPSATTFKESTVGFHVGLDLNYMIARHVGGGVLLRYTRGSVDFPHSTSSMTVGGVQIGVGLRTRF